MAPHHVDTLRARQPAAARAVADFLLDRPELRYPARLNCAVELLDRNIARPRRPSRRSSRRPRR
jgi:2-aminobenzoate-CoA ligase